MPLQDFPSYLQKFLWKILFSSNIGTEKWAWCYDNLPPGWDFWGRMGLRVWTAWRHPAHPLPWASALPSCSAPLQPLPTLVTCYIKWRSFELERLSKSQIFWGQLPHQKNGYANTHHIYFPEQVRVNKQMSESPSKSMVPCATSTSDLDHVPWLGWAHTTSRPQQSQQLKKGSWTLEGKW